MELSFFFKFSWFLVLTTFSQWLSGYFTFPVVWLICIWLLIRCQSSLYPPCSQLRSLSVLALSSIRYHLPTAQLILLCQMLSYAMGFLVPQAGETRVFPQPLCLGRCLQGSCTFFGLQFPLDSSSFWRMVSVLDFRSMISSSSYSGTVEGPMIYFWIAPPFSDGLFYHLCSQFPLLNSFC